MADARASFDRLGETASRNADGHRGLTRSNVLVISNLHRQFGDLVALDDVSLSVGRGEIVGLVGRNGAGKTIPS